MLRKNVMSLLEQLQVCIFAEIVFGIRCTLKIQEAIISGTLNFTRFLLKFVLSQSESL